MNINISESQIVGTKTVKKNGIVTGLTDHIGKEVLILKSLEGINVQHGPKMDLDFYKSIMDIMMANTNWEKLVDDLKTNKIDWTVFQEQMNQQLSQISFQVGKVPNSPHNQEDVISATQVVIDKMVKKSKQNEFILRNSICKWFDKKDNQTQFPEIKSGGEPKVYDIFRIVIPCGWLMDFQRFISLWQLREKDRLSPFPEHPPNQIYPLVINLRDKANSSVMAKKYLKIRNTHTLSDSFCAEYDELDGLWITQYNNFIDDRYDYHNEIIITIETNIPIDWEKSEIKIYVQLYPFNEELFQ